MNDASKRSRLRTVGICLIVLAGVMFLICGSSFTGPWPVDRRRDGVRSGIRCIRRQSKRQLLVGAIHSIIKTCDLPSGRLIAQWEAQIEDREHSIMNKLALAASPDGTRVVTGGGDN